MDIETLELADATREQAQATERQTEVLAAHVKALAGVSKGEQGVKGETGDVGPIGPNGKSIRGPQGPAGKNGTNGTNGAKGDPGPVGPEGPAGKDGVGPDERVRVSKKDPAAGFLADKLKAGLGVRLRQEKSPDGDSLVIDSVGQSGGMGGGGMAGLSVYDDGVAVGFGDKVSYDGGDPVTISGGIIHVPVGSGGGGSGLPPQWTDGGNGDVTATVDDITKTAITIEGLTGQTAPLLDITGNGADGAQAIVATLADDFEDVLYVPTGDTGNLTGNAYVIRIRDVVNNRHIFDLDAWGSILINGPADPGAGSGGINVAGAFVADTTGQMKLVGTTHQSLIRIGGVSGDPPENGVMTFLYNSGIPQIGFFDKVTSGGDVQQTAASLSDLWTALKAYGLLDSGSAAPAGGGGTATDPGDIADPTLATPESNALKINTLFANMRTAGMLA